MYIWKDTTFQLIHKASYFQTFHFNSNSSRIHKNSFKTHAPNSQTLSGAQRIITPNYLNPQAHTRRHRKNKNKLLFKITRWSVRNYFAESLSHKNNQKAINQRVFKSYWRITKSMNPKFKRNHIFVIILLEIINSWLQQKKDIKIFQTKKERPINFIITSFQ